MASLRPRSTELNDQPASSSRNTIRLLSIVTVLGVLIGVAGILVPKAFSYDGNGSSGDGKQVISRVSDFATAYNTYDVAELADYQKRLKGLLTPSYDKEFVKITNSIFQALTDKKQVSKDAKVVDVAIDSIDKDSAVVLVAVDSSVTNTDAKTAIARHLRWKVNLIKQKGQWNIDKFESVAALAASNGTPTAAPSAQPSDGSTAK